MTTEDEAQRCRLWEPPPSMAERTSSPKVGIGITGDMNSNRVYNKHPAAIGRELERVPIPISREFK